MKPTEPFLKWAGGKRQLLSEIKKRMPDSYQNYYEPFIGGGALLFDLQPEHAHINDINPALVCTYEQIRDHVNAVIDYVQTMDKQFQQNEQFYPDDPTYYNLYRDRFNSHLKEQIYNVQTAALFIFLNKHCFNGLYRVNRAGQFNVPWNKKTNDSIDTQNIKAVSEYLKTTAITNLDFEKALKPAKPKDFIFLDSPYAPVTDTSFEAYTKQGFPKEDHIRLKETVNKLSEKGCYCMLTNHDTPFIRELYHHYHIESVTVRRAINSDAKHRTGTEVIITNY